MKPFVVEFQPAGTRLACREPVLVLEAAARAGVKLKSVCGGKATCGKCLVRVTAIGTGEGAVSPLTNRERLLLSEAEVAAGYRLACVTVVSGDVRVFVPPSSVPEEQRLQVAWAGPCEAPEPDPVVERFHIHVPPATVADQRGDFERAADSLRQGHAVSLREAHPETLAQLTCALRAGNWEITAAVRGGSREKNEEGELVASYPGDLTGGPAVGIAVDLGTTKIACYLVDLVTGRTLASRGVMNPQIAYGEDVVARIEAAVRDKAARRALKESVIATLNQVAADLCGEVGLTTDDILEFVVVGNTAMHHLALGLPVEQLAVVPFVAATTRPLDVRCAELGLVGAPGARAHFPPLIAGFVGSDHVAALLAGAFGRDGRTLLAVDLGTNTEVALQARGRIRSCSTACGPAFEGAHIRFGMRAAPGAIERVAIDATTGQVHVETVDGRPAVGICGSGILDAIASLLRMGWLNGRGRLVAGSPGVRRGPDTLEFVLIADEGGKHVATGSSEPVADGANGGREIVLTQKDLDQIQLAKGAIRAGIDILMEDMAVRPDEIDEVIVAGAFGTYLDPANALRLGLFPPVPLSRFRQVGNAAGAGAVAALVSRTARQEAVRLAGLVDYLELTLHPDFGLRFAEAMRYSAGPGTQDRPT